MVIKRPGVGKSGTGKTPPKFQYRPRTAEEMNKRAHQNAGNREGCIKPEINTWSPSDGENKIRILPPTWEDAEHYGIEVWVHYNIGSDKGTYLCLNKQDGVTCPICEVRSEMDHAGDNEAARDFIPRKRVGMFVIDRAQEQKGPLLWLSPWTLDQEIAKQAIDEDGGALALDNPGEGYDITFSREQQGKNVPPKYVGVKVARKSSPLFDDDNEIEAALNYVMENPIPTTLVHHEYDTVKAVFEGGPAVKRTAEETAPERPRPKLVAGKAVRPAPEPEAEEEDPEDDDDTPPTWEEVHALDEDAVTALAEKHELDFGEEEFDDLEQCQDWVCAQLSIEKPKPAKTGKPVIGSKNKATTESAPPASAGGWKGKLDKFKK